MLCRGRRETTHAHSQPAKWLEIGWPLLSLSCNIHTTTTTIIVRSHQVLRVHAAMTASDLLGSAPLDSTRDVMLCCSFGIYLFIFTVVQLLFVSLFRVTFTFCRLLFPFFFARPTKAPATPLTRGNIFSSSFGSFPFISR